MTEDKYQKILKEYWGYQDFRGIQRDIIESICAGRDTLGLMPTGGGKSITFQVPAIAMRGVCIVITPLIALMKDQVDRLRQKGIKAYALFGSLQYAEILKILDNAVLGGVTLLYVSPERLSSELFLNKLRHMKVSFVTVDEAHCICQWGYDFRPSYLAISDIRKIKPDAPILALTATATLPAIDDIQKQLGFREKNVFRMSFMRRNISYIVRHADDKLDQTAHIIRSLNGSAIVYVYSRKKTKEVADYLNAQGISATFYHAGLENSVRESRQSMWQEDRVKVMVATNAFGMGIDKPDVRVVIHIDSPDSMEAYFQEAGRAGRDGERAYAVLLFNGRDKSIMNRRIADSYPDKEYVKTVYEHLAYFFQLATGSGFNKTFEFSLDKFCRNFKHFPTRVEPALRILEKAGYIEYREESDNKARMRFLIGRNDLYRLNDMSQDENAIVVAALRNYSGMFSDYAYIDESLIAQQSGTDEHTVHETLKALSRKHIIHFIPRKSIPHIKYTQSRVDTDEIVIPVKILEWRKKLAEKRIEAIVTYAEEEKVCRSQQLLNYFGETKSEKCGHCDVCIGQKKRTKEDKQKDTAIRQAILKLLGNRKPHHIKELYTLDFDMPSIERVLKEMADEEAVYNIDGQLTL